MKKHKNANEGSSSSVRGDSSTGSYTQDKQYRMSVLSGDGSNENNPNIDANTAKKRVGNAANVDPEQKIKEAYEEPTPTPDGQSQAAKFEVMSKLKNVAEQTRKSMVKTRHSQSQMLIKHSDDGYMYFEQEKVNSTENMSKWMIRVNDTRKTNWDVFIIILAIYNCFSIPFEISFTPEFMEGPIFFIVNTCIDLMFLGDIFVSFRTTFYDRETGDEVFEARRTSSGYLKGRFTIDVLSTVPFDNLALLFTKTKSPLLQLFSLLKLARVTRLSRIIAKMNVKQDVKNGMKLAQLIFNIVMYIHCLACLWFVVANSDQQWKPPLDYVDPDADLYSDSLVHKYWISVYHAVLLLTGNDIIPRGTFQIAFVAVFITMGAIINANIFGNMALIISDLNKKSAEFQSQIDTANTAMKNMKLPQEIQTKVISYLQYIQQTLDHQNELGQFFDLISPSLKEEVTRFIFAGALAHNPVFKERWNIKDFLLQKIQLVMSQPEEIKIQQGDETFEFYIIARGECECFVKDETRKEKFVNTLKVGKYFGEIALITGNRRTATIQTKNYSTIGMITADHFDELCHLFPEIKKKLHDGMINYKDPYKKWQKIQLQNINYLKEISQVTLEELTYKLGHEFFEEGQVLFKNGDEISKIYILANGTVDTYVSLSDEDLILDKLKIQGTVFGQFTILDKEKITYSARATSETNMLVLDKAHLQKHREDYKDLNEALSRTMDMIKEEGMPMLDYQASRRPPTINALFKEEKFDAIRVFKECVQKLLDLKKFNRKKEFKFSELLKFLRNQEMTEVERKKQQAEELMGSIRPLLQQKIEKLLTDRVDRLLGTVERQDFKISKITDVLNHIYEAKGGPPQNKSQVAGGKSKGAGRKSFKAALSLDTELQIRGGISGGLSGGLSSGFSAMDYASDFKGAGAVPIPEEDELSRLGTNEMREFEESHDRAREASFEEKGKKTQPITQVPRKMSTEQILHQRLSSKTGQEAPIKHGRNTSKETDDDVDKLLNDIEGQIGEHENQNEEDGDVTRLVNKF